MTKTTKTTKPTAFERGVDAGYRNAAKNLRKMREQQSAEANKMGAVRFSAEDYLFTTDAACGNFRAQWNRTTKQWNVIATKTGQKVAFHARLEDVMSFVDTLIRYANKRTGK